MLGESALVDFCIKIKMTFILKRNIKKSPVLPRVLP